MMARWLLAACLWAGCCACGVAAAGLETGTEVAASVEAEIAAAESGTPDTAPDSGRVAGQDVAGGATVDPFAAAVAALNAKSYSAKGRAAVEASTALTCTANASTKTAALAESSGAFSAVACNRAGRLRRRTGVLRALQLELTGKVLVIHDEDVDSPAGRTT